WSAQHCLKGCAIGSQLAAILVAQCKRVGRVNGVGPPIDDQPPLIRAWPGGVFLVPMARKGKKRLGFIGECPGGLCQCSVWLYRRFVRVHQCSVGWPPPG